MPGEASHSSGVVARGTELRRAGLEPISNAPRAVDMIDVSGRSTQKTGTYRSGVSSWGTFLIRLIHE